MIVCIPTLSEEKNNLSGKSLFCSRLATCLRESGVKVIKDLNKKHNISLNLVFSQKTKFKSAKRVVRLDGIWHNLDQPYKKMNDPISKSINDCDGVVYQTLFCKKVSDKYIGKSSAKLEVIYNGADPLFYDNIIPAKRKAKNCFITYARWRPQKRLRDAIKSFLMADIEDSILYVAGDISKCGIPKTVLKKYFSKSNIEYLGHVNQYILASYLKICKASIHLSWIDWCPNSVVEAICCGIPVITNNVGGTQEIVRLSGGIVCDIDAKWDLSPCKLYNPPPVDKRIVADALIKCVKENIKTNYYHVDIANVAKAYINFFLKVLE